MSRRILPGALVFAVAVIVGAGVYYAFFSGERVSLPEGESRPLTSGTSSPAAPRESNREIMVTDGDDGPVRHSISLDEVQSGGPPKDGIPSIDDPQFISTAAADEWLSDDEPGLGVTHDGTARFYPYQILVWHEIVNEAINGDPLLVTYCPLCRTGIVFERVIDGQAVEFGVSGKLWRSNLLMYNRGPDGEEDSLWSQVLGEAVVGPRTGETLEIVPSDTVRYGQWKQTYPETQVLSRETGTSRSYGRDPYGDYYSSDRVSFGASFDDDRLHPKEIVLGVEVDGQYKAYHEPSLPTGTMDDAFAGVDIEIETAENGQVRMYRLQEGERQQLPYVRGFWFSWLAVHPDTKLFSNQNQ